MLVDEPLRFGIKEFTEHEEKSPVDKNAAFRSNVAFRSELVNYSKAGFTI
jgi:hypothetical protein